MWYNWGVEMLCIYVYSDTRKKGYKKTTDVPELMFLFDLSCLSIVNSSLGIYRVR